MNPTSAYFSIVSFVGVVSLLAAGCHVAEGSNPHEVGAVASAQEDSPTAETGLTETSVAGCTPVTPLFGRSRVSENPARCEIVETVPIAKHTSRVEPSTCAQLLHEALSKLAVDRRDATLEATLTVVNNNYKGFHQILADGSIRVESLFYEAGQIHMPGTYHGTHLFTIANDATISITTWYNTQRDMDRTLGDPDSLRCINMEFARKARAFSGHPQVVMQWLDAMRASLCKK